MPSKGEDRVADVLRQMHLPFEREYSFPGLVGRSGRSLRFDFAVKDRSGRVILLIEFQGRQHYFPVDVFGGASGFRRQQRNDREKREFCLRHGIDLATIPFYDEDRIDADYIRRLLPGR